MYPLALEKTHNKIVEKVKQYLGTSLKLLQKHCTSIAVTTTNVALPCPAAWGKSDFSKQESSFYFL
jgi:hypothetical protein